MVTIKTLSITAAAGTVYQRQTNYTKLQGNMQKDFYVNNIGDLYSSYTKYADTRFTCCNTAGSTVAYTIVNAVQYS